MAVAPTPRKRHALDLFSGLPRHYDRMGALLSFGQDPRWRRALVASLPLGPGNRVLDVATGTGLVAAALVSRFGCSVVGLDQSDEMLAAARARLAAQPELAERVELVRGEAERLPFGDGEFDALTFSYLLRYVDDPAATMRELARVVKPGGSVASLEFGVPPSPPLRALWCAYTRAGLPLVGRLVSREWEEVGRFLGPSICAFAARFPEPELRLLWEDAGIRVAELRRMSFGAGVLIRGERDGVA
ncbi:MAG: class I SAM-dependent methyltransferase [Thermoleophilaceae bacterium]|nr:class I SAM-dependent methyltransferase [Thermoleophilaceae bacterium]